ncbi:MAG: transcriptional repressor NrdR [Bradymonadia bacterium]|jgi:transcriptional repressor NrdR
MRCPQCGEDDDKVVDSRQSREGDAIRRRRECLQCNLRFTTYETVERTMPLVVKRDDRREPFERDKIRRALGIACQKRPVSAAEIDALIHRVEERVAASGEREVSARFVGDIVIDELQAVDGVAYVRFASVYYSFDDINEFAQAVRKVRTAGRA